MKGRSALEEVKAGVGRISELAKMIDQCERKLQGLEGELSDDEMMSVVEKYGECKVALASIAAPKAQAQSLADFLAAQGGNGHAV